MADIDVTTALISFAVVAFVLFFLWVAFNPAEVWFYRNVPGPNGLPFLGCLPLIQEKGMLEATQILKKQYGPVFKLWVGRRCVVMVNDADAAKKVLSMSAIRAERFPQALLGKETEFVNAMLIHASGPYWRMARKIFDAALIKQSSLAGYFELMDKCAEGAVTRLGEIADTGKTLDIRHEIATMTLNVIGKSSYGTHFGGDVLSTLSRIVGATTPDNMSFYLILIVLLAPIAPFLRKLAYWLPDSKQAFVLKALRELCDANEKLLKKARNEKAAEELDGKIPSSFLQGLMASWGTDPGDGKMTDLQVYSNAFTLIISGYETTSNTLAFAVYLLSVHPDKLAKLLKEIDEANLPAPGTKPLTQEDLEKVPYAEAVTKEALRLFTPTPYVTRILDKKCVIEGVELAVGSYMQVDINAVQRDTKNWVDPDAFIPERFVPGCDDVAPKNPNAYMPFGQGARMCVGYKYAMQEARIALIRFFQTYTFEMDPYNSQHPLPISYGFTRGPKNPVMVQVHRRNKKA